ncbi:MAG: hypothetical protein Q9219_006451 [cf. Caloplaca sp. 3 TL-2023]
MAQPTTSEAANVLRLAVDLALSVPLLKEPMVYIPLPDWEQNSSILHESVAAISGLEHCFEALSSLLQSRLSKLESFPEKGLMVDCFANNIKSTIAKVSQASDQLADLDCRMRWRKVQVVEFQCTLCEADQRRDWTHLVEHWDHPPGWITTSLANEGGLRNQHPFDLNLESVFELSQSHESHSRNSLEDSA